MTQEQTLGTGVVALLTARGYRATFEYPGWICIVQSTGHWQIGTANGNWGAEFIEGPTGEQTGTFELADSANETDAGVITGRIIQALAQFRD